MCLRHKTINDNKTFLQHFFRDTNFIASKGLYYKYIPAYIKNIKNFKIFLYNKIIKNKQEFLYDINDYLNINIFTPKTINNWYYKKTHI